MAFRRFCEAAAAGAPIEIFGDGRQTRDFTFVGDVVAAVLAAAEADGVGGEAYNIGGGSRVSLAGALELLAALAGRPLDVRHRELADALSRRGRLRGLISGVLRRRCCGYRC